ncbi:MAG: TonB-dependent receptor [Caulobacterales bacterium]|uniref:TonB-dependent receptor n=1 Tax=Glycocaulis sp. TaxID=1969725 RepID=UPI003FA05258
MKKSILLSSAAVLAVTALTTGAAIGQEAEEAASSSNAREIITVTARRREETILDAPVAVTAFGQEDILNLGLQSVDDVARFTPGLSFSAAFGRTSERPVIRGQANVLAGVQFGVESGTAYFVDGVYYPGSIQNLDPNDLARVEVIRGPQSALYGRNTYAGAINFVTRGGTDEVEANLRGRYGSHGEHEVSGGISGPLGPNAGFRVSLRDYHYDGEYTNTVTGQTVGSQSTTSFSGVLDFSPTSNIDFRVRAQYSDSSDGTLPLFLQPASANNCSPGYRSLNYWSRSGSTNNNQYFCGVIRPGPIALNTGPAVPGQPAIVPGVPANALNPFLPFQLYSTADGTAFDGVTNETLLFSGIMDWDLGGSGYILSLSAGYRDEERRFGSDSDHSSINFVLQPAGMSDTGAFFANTTRNEVVDYSLEARLASPLDRRFRWMVGAYMYDQTSDQFSITFSNLSGNPSSELTTTNQAVFGLLEFDFTDNLTMTLEGRYAEEEKTTLDGIGTATPFNRTDTFDNFTPRLTLNWSVNPETTVFAVYSRGVKPGGQNGAIGASVGQPTYDQETSDNFEIGVKQFLFGGAGYFAASAYYIDATDVQLTTAVASVGGALNSVATNQGSAEILGLELEYRQQVNDYLSIGATYAWTRPEFTEGCDDAQWELTSGGGVIAGNATAPGTGTQFFGATGNCSIAGNRIPLTSEHQLSLNAEVRAPIGSTGTLEWFLRGDYTYESSKFVQVHNLAETGDASIFGAQLGIEGESWTIMAYGRNIFDEDSIVMATRWLQTPYLSTGFSPNTAPVNAARGAPRAFFGTLRRGASFGIEARYRF